MNLIASDLLRSTVSNVMNVLLLFSLAQPKFNKRNTNRIMFFVITISILFSCFFYFPRNLTVLAKYNVIFSLILYMALKPLFLDSLMQWIFNLFTVINVYAIIVVLSYYLCQYLPYFSYAITLLRFLLFLLVILLFRRRLRPIYRQAAAHWRVFILLVIGIFINMVYYFMFSKNIVETLTNEMVPLLLLSFLALAAYICIFYSLKITSNEFALREENIKIEAREELLNAELSAYEDYVDISRQFHHDLRHHNALIKEILSQEDSAAALTYLNEYDNSIVDLALQKLCNNSVANAILCLYQRRAHLDGINYILNINIPTKLPITAPEIGGMLSNLLENAWISCKNCEENIRFITVYAEVTDNQFFLEVKNSVCNPVEFIDSLPVSRREGGGTGIKSIKRIVDKHGGMYRFKQDGNEFTAQIIISL